MFKFAFDLNPKKMRWSEEVIKEMESDGSKIATKYANVFENLLTAIIRSLGGLEGRDARIYNRILSKLDEASDKCELEIEIETSEVDLLKSLLLNDKVKIDPTLIRAMGIYQQKIESLV